MTALVNALIEESARSQSGDLSACTIIRIASGLLSLAANSDALGDVDMRTGGGTSEGRTAIMTANDDMPYLLDAITGLLQEHGLPIHCAVSLLWPRLLQASAAYATDQISGPCPPLKHRKQRKPVNCCNRKD